MAHIWEGAPREVEAGLEWLSSQGWYGGTHAFNPKARDKEAGGSLYGGGKPGLQRENSSRATQ